MRQKNRILSGCLLVFFLFFSGCDQAVQITGASPGEGMQLATLSRPAVAETPSPTQSLVPQILLTDDFEDSASGWETYEDETGHAGYSNGGYLVESTQSGKTMWGTAGVEFSDIRIDVETETLSAPENGNNAFGIDCRIQSNGDGYSFHISSDGWFTILKFENKQSITLYDWTQTDAVQQGLTKNQLAAICQGNRLSFEVNGILLAEISDSSFSSGDIALSASTFEADPTSVRFDDIVVQRLENAPLSGENETYALEIHNPTRFTVCAVYIVPSQDGFWGSSLLEEGEVVGQGGTRSFSGLPDRMVDIKAETCQNLRLYEDYEVDLSGSSSIDLVEPQLLQHNEFSDIGDWTSGTVEGGAITIRNNDYYSLSALDGSLLLGNGNLNAGDVSIIADASMVKKGANSLGIYGVTCRMQPDRSGIYFAIRGDGSASINKINQGVLEPLTEWKTSDYILPGIDSNFIEGDCVGSTYTLFVNGDFIGSVEDGDFSTGLVGTAVYSPPGSSTQADFDFLDVYQGF